MKICCFLTLVDSLHPMGHCLVPNLKCDDIIGDETKEPDQALLDVVSPEKKDGLYFLTTQQPCEEALIKLNWKHSSCSFPLTISIVSVTNNTFLYIIYLFQL